MMRAVAQFPSPASRQPPSWHGVVLFSSEEPGSPTTVAIDISGLDPDTYHAIHVHEGHLLCGQTCHSVGPHWNPLGQNHGSILLDAQARHAGDLCNNVLSGPTGNVRLAYQDPTIDLWNPHLSPVGRSVVVHEGIDDLGLGGVFHRHGRITAPLVDGSGGGLFATYESMSTDTLLAFYEAAHYGHAASREVALEKLLAESSKTGNAGGRMACANVVAVM
jgi:Cu-Zn family superoxide dismutase